MSPIAVTGVTGQVGRLVATELAKAGRRLRLLARAESASRAPTFDGAELALTSYGDGPAARAALAGVDLLFMVSAAEAPDRLADHRTFIDAAAAAGVKHVVYTSILNCGPNATFTLARDHWATEEHLRASGMAFTFLRDNFYLDFLPLLAGKDGVIRGPAGSGVLGAVARADVVRTAAAVLSSPEAHIGKTYQLTGREMLSLADVARMLSFTYHDETVEEAYASRAGSAETWQLDAWVSTYTAIAAGDFAVVSKDIETLTGRPPMTFREFLDAQSK